MDSPGGFEVLPLGILNFGLLAHCSFYFTFLLWLNSTGSRKNKEKGISKEDEGEKVGIITRMNGQQELSMDRKRKMVDQSIEKKKNLT